MTQAGTALLIRHDGQAKIEQYVIARMCVEFNVVAFNVAMLYTQLMTMAQRRRKLRGNLDYFFYGEYFFVRRM